MTTNVCFVTAHPNPANHFAQFVQAFEEQETSCTVLAEKNVQGKFSQVKSNVIPFDASILENDTLYEQLISKIPLGSIVVTDIGSEKWAILYQKLAEDHPNIKRIAYYDNPEQYVPGGYSELAARVIDAAQGVLFANKGHVQQGIEKSAGVALDLSKKELIGVGYYPEKEAQTILEQRQNTLKVQQIKSSFFERHGIQERGSKIFTYAGGANEVYYEKAFPKFIEMIAELLEKDPSHLENTVVLLQQHPRAKREGNLDAKLVEDLVSKTALPKGFHFVISDVPTIDSLVLCDGAFYYQTSMAAQFALGGIPTVMQVGHDTYPDLLIKTGFPSATEAETLSKAFNKVEEGSTNLEALKEKLGMDHNWKENLVNGLKKA